MQLRFFDSPGIDHTSGGASAVSPGTAQGARAPFSRTGLGESE